MWETFLTKAKISKMKLSPGDQKVHISPRQKQGVGRRGDCREKWQVLG